MPKKWLGEKAESLLKLKKDGLFNQGLVILAELPKKEDFKILLLNEGLSDGMDLSVRFSSPSKATNLPRSIIINSFDAAYAFIEKNKADGLTAIIHKFVTSDLSGSLLMEKGVVYLSLINGAWEMGSAQCCDNVILEGNKAKVFYFAGEKECLFVSKDKLVRKKVVNSREEIKAAVISVLGRIKKLGLEENILYELFLTPENELVFMEFKHSSGTGCLTFKENHAGLFEVKALDGLENWDGKKDLLLSVPVDREQEAGFHELIEKVKARKDRVYVTYGICSHPCILLREAGLEVIPCNKERSVFEINLD